jgi:hypothetical protein
MYNMAKAKALQTMLLSKLMNENKKDRGKELICSFPL